MRKWIKDLQTFSDADIKTMARYYKINVNDKDVHLALALKISKSRLRPEQEVPADRFFGRAEKSRFETRGFKPIENSLNEFSKKASLPPKDQLPYGGDINKAMQARDREAIKIIMAYRAEEAKSKPAPEIKPVLAGRGCSNETDYISSEDWSENYKPDLKIYFLKSTSGNQVDINKDFNVMCANKVNFLKWIKDPAHQFRGWVPLKKGNVEGVDDNGHGGRPSFFEKFIKTPINFIIPSFNLWAPEEYIAIPIYKEKRVGNAYGVFAIGSLHGQLPGETIYYVFPAPEKEENITNYIKSQLIEGMDRIIVDSFDVTFWGIGIEPSSLIEDDPDVKKYYGNVISDAIMQYLINLSKKELKTLFGKKYDELIKINDVGIKDELEFIKKAGDNEIIGEHLVKIMEISENKPSAAATIVTDIIRTFSHDNLKNLDLNVLINLITIMNASLVYTNEYDENFVPDLNAYYRVYGDQPSLMEEELAEGEEMEYYLVRACDSDIAFKIVMDKLDSTNVEQDMLLKFLDTKCSNEDRTIKIVIKLYELGVNFNNTDEDENNAIMLVAREPNYNSKVLEIVLSLSLEPQAEYTPANGASGVYSYEVNINATDIDGNNALTDCIIDTMSTEGGYDQDFYEKCELLLKAGCNPNSKGGFKSAIDFAVGSGDLELVNLLLKYKADVKDEILNANSPEMINLLLKNKANINAIEDLQGNNALIKMIIEDELDFDDEELKDHVIDRVNVLIKNKINVNAQNNFGETALMLAARNGITELVEILLNAGADKNIKNKKNLTALDFANRKKFNKYDDLYVKNREIIEMLEHSVVYY